MRSRGRWQLWSALALSMALFALLRFRPESEADLGWHLAQGRLLAQGHWMRTNALAWTAPGEPWVDTSWLFDLLAYASTKLWPAPLGPKLLTALFVAATLGFSGLACLEVAPLGVWLLPGLSLLLATKATPRPHAASWMTLACVLWLCLRAWREERGGVDPAASRELTFSRGARLRLLALLPLWIGAQLHAGAAFALAPLALFSLESWWRSRRPGALWPLALAPIVYLAGPSGPAGLLHLLRHWDVAEIVQINEFLPWTLAKEPLLPALVALALAGILVAQRAPGASDPTRGANNHTRGANDPTIGANEAAPSRGPRLLLALLACELLFAALALRTLRLFYEHALVCLPALALTLEPLSARFGRRAAALALLLFSIACALPHGIAQALLTPSFEPRWNEGHLPVRAARFLDSHPLGERGFNGLRDGGQLAWERPGAPVFIDARVHAYPASLWHALEAAEHSPARFDEFLREQGAEWALAEREDERFSGYRLLDRMSEWALIYWDEADALYVRRDVPRFAALIAALEYRWVTPWGNPLEQLGAMPPAGLAQLDAELARFLGSSPDDAWALAMSCASGVRQAAPDKARRCVSAVQAAHDAGNEPLLELLQALTK